MGFSCGIVGLPNVGKSTIFNALTQAGIEAANYPFCTIEPNVGRVPMPDPRLQAITDLVKPRRSLPTYMEFVDIAGLVAGAAQGEGLGNKFLSHIRETQAIAHVVRCFDDDNITHVSGKINPLADIETIETELVLADIDTLQKRILKLEKIARSGDKEARVELAALATMQQHLDSGVPARLISDQEILLIPTVKQLITAKKQMFIANIHEQQHNSADLQALQDFAAQRQSPVVCVCAAIEAEIAELPPEERHDFLAELGQEEPGLNRIIQAGYDLLGLQTYFTAGEKEVRAWTIAQGATAPQAAGVIHSDFERGFIRAEIVGYDDFISCNGEAGAKEAGKWRLEGKDYIMQDGDVTHFLFNV